MLNKVAHCALWATLSLMLGAPAVTAGSQGVAGEADLESSLQQLTAEYDRIRDARDGVVMAPVRMIRDLHGRTLADNMRENVLVPSVRDHLDALFQSATAALSSDTPATAAPILAEITTTLAHEDERFRAIKAYWSRRGAQRPNRRPYLSHLRRNGIEPRHAAEIKATEAAFEQQIDTGLFVAAMNVTFPRLRDLYERAANEEAAQLHTAMKREGFVPFRTQEGNLKCAHATKTTSGSSVPKIVSSLLMDDYYPAASRRAGEGGYLIMDVLVARNGCPARATVTVSSGYEHLDTLAMSYAVHASYQPAERRGRAIGATLSFPMRFERPE